MTKALLYMINYGLPLWFHHHGSKMRITEQTAQPSPKLVIEGSAATLTIRKLDSSPQKEGWIVEWQIMQCQPHGSKVEGRLWYKSRDLMAAFGLDETLQGAYRMDWLIKTYNADCAAQGRFIRKGLFLNIPCPGTSHDGDPNISIQLNQEIKNAVAKLIHG